MPKISRTLYTPFGRDAVTDDIAQFGSKVAGTPLKTKNLSLIQSLTAWVTGWKNAVFSADKLPLMEDVNAVDYVHGQMLGYIFQEGVPEWEANTTYPQYAMVKKAGTYELYGSKVDDNVGNALPTQTDDTNWKFLGPSSGLTGEIKSFAGVTVPTGYLGCDGAAVSRTTYANLFAAIGTTWGSGDGSTTFNVPDMRGRAPFGKAAAGTFGVLGSSGGSDTHYHVMADHTHGIAQFPFTVQSSLTPKPYVCMANGYLFAVTENGAGPFFQRAASGTTGSGLTAVNSASNIPPFAVVNFIIKT